VSLRQRAALLLRAAQVRVHRAARVDDEGQPAARAVAEGDAGDARALAHAVELEGRLEQIGHGRVGLDGEHASLRTGETRGEQREVAVVGARVDDRHVRLHESRQALGDVHLPDAVHEQVRGQGAVARVDEQCEAPQHATQAARVAEIGVVTLGPDRAQVRRTQPRVAQPAEPEAAGLVDGGSGSAGVAGRLGRGISGGIQRLGAGCEGGREHGGWHHPTGRGALLRTRASETRRALGARPLEKIRPVAGWSLRRPGGPTVDCFAVDLLPSST
jgi:hypothetical protein